MKRIIVGLTGASGSILFKKTIEALVFKKIEIYLIATSNGEKVFEYELGISFKQYIRDLNYKFLQLCEIDDMFSKVASGSFHVDGMIVLPCSMGTIGKIANGTSDNLLIRACDVQIKEKTRVLLGFRETPLSSIHLNNLLTLSQAGVIIFPTVAAFYHHPQSIDDITNQIVTRVLSYFEISLDTKIEWKGLI